jgi:hypothetical protein
VKNARINVEDVSGKNPLMNLDVQIVFLVMHLEMMIAITVLLFLNLEKAAVHVIIVVLYKNSNAPVVKIIIMPGCQIHMNVYQT